MEILLSFIGFFLLEETPKHSCEVPRLTVLDGGADSLHAGESAA